MVFKMDLECFDYTSCSDKFQLDHFWIVGKVVNDYQYVELFQMKYVRCNFLQRMRGQGCCDQWFS